MKIVIGCDHAALTLKDAVKAHLLELGHEVKDFGIYQAGEKCDYPEKAAEVARYLRDGNAERGILICGTGVGMSIAANKVKGIRACCCSDTFSARMTRAHNDANILTFGERVVGQGLAMELVDAFLTTEFEGGRHQRRVDLITKLELLFFQKLQSCQSKIIRSSADNIRSFLQRIKFVYLGFQLLLRSICILIHNAGFIKSHTAGTTDQGTIVNILLQNLHYSIKQE